jgi:hypothetical protein
MLPLWTPHPRGLLRLDRRRPQEGSPNLSRRPGLLPASLRGGKSSKMSLEGRGNRPLQRRCLQGATTIANDDDVREAAETLGGMGPEIILITSGTEGSYIYDHKTFRKIQPYPIDELVDPTGAGDAYSAGFLVRYLRTGSPIPSARFASCVASFIVQGWGASNPPAEETVLDKMRRLHSERDNAFTWMDSR